MDSPRIAQSGDLCWFYTYVQKLVLILETLVHMVVSSIIR